MGAIIAILTNSIASEDFLDKSKKLARLDNRNNNINISTGDINTSENVCYDIDIQGKKKNTDDDVLINLKSRLCKNNTNHSRFYLVSELQLDDLPNHLKTDEILQLVKNAAATVVCICVHFTSSRRKKDMRYANVCTTNTECRYATGWVCLPFQSEQSNNLIRIITARHVIYNNTEAKSTEVTFCFDHDGPNDNDNTNQKAVAQGVRLHIMDDDRDFAVLECEIQDVTLRERIRNALIKLTNDSLQLESITTSSDKEIDAFIISHPHGGSKHVSFGTCKNIVEFDAQFDINTGEKIKAMNLYKYDIATCPGSSGAPVIILGRAGVNYFWTPHCYVDHNSKYGVSAKGLVDWRQIDNATYNYKDFDKDLNVNL